MSIKSVLFLAFGAASTIGFTLFLVFSLPVYLLRVFVNSWLKPCFKPKLGSILDAQSSLVAYDLWSGKPPRSTVIVKLLFDGHVPPEQVKRNLRTNFVHRIDPITGELAYPQFTQHPISWLGFLFWENDVKFKLDDHLYFHQGKVATSSENSHDEIDTYMQRLLNAPYHPERSPWEVNVIENYCNHLISPDPMTCCLFKFHHSFGDGFTVQRVLIEGFLDTQLDNVKLAKPYVIKKNIFVQIFQWISVPIAFLVEFSSLLSNAFASSSWSVEDKDKEWNQLYAKSQLIPVERIKLIKNKLGVSYSSVLISAVSEAIYEFGVESKQRHGEDRMLCLTPIPTPGSGNLGNKSTSVFFYLPIGHFDTPIDRLRVCDKILSGSKKTMMPTFFKIAVTALGCHLSLVRKLACKNTLIPTGISNFPSALQTLNLNGHKLLMSEFAAGALEGNGGAGFMVISYNKWMRIAITAESALLSKTQINQVIASIHGHLDELHALAINK